MTIQGIIFDYGQVLTAPTDLTAVTKHRAQLARRIGLEAAELWPYLFEGRPAMALMTGQIDWETFWISVLKPKGITDPDEILAFSEAVFEGSEEINPEMAALVEELHGRYKLAILSNANWAEAELAEEITKRDGNPDLFDAILTSASTGVAKPDPTFYQLALERLNLPAEACVFTDDLGDFTAAAAQLGFHTFTFTNPAEFRQYLKELGVVD